MVERYLDDQFVRRGGLTRKWVSPGHNGVPDRIGVLKGKVWFIEVKTQGGKVSPCQEREHKLLIDQGCTVRVIYGVSDVYELMKEIDNE